jgi:hypothetical protein
MTSFGTRLLAACVFLETAIVAYVLWDETRIRSARAGR